MGTDNTMLQPPMILHQHHHQQLPSSFIDSHHSPPSMHHPHHHRHHTPHLSPISSSSSPPHSHFRSLSPLQHNISRASRGSSSEIETGVWTCSDIPADVTFGPFDGDFTLGNGMKDHRDTPYMLEVSYYCLYYHMVCFFFLSLSHF